MAHHDIHQLRNIGIMAHIDAGKTTTTERILYYTGLTHKVGEVHDGNTVMDWMEQEQERGITITSAATSCDWKHHKINLIDTPGHVDFTVEVERCLRILDGAIFLLDAKEGVEAQTKVVSHQADHYNVPRLIFMNKMDTVGADFERSLASIKSELEGNPIPLQLPIGTEKDFEGVICLIEMKALYNTGKLGETLVYKEIPDTYLGQANHYRSQLVEALAEKDDDLLEAYLEGDEIEPSVLHLAIRRAVLAGLIIPVLCGSAFKNKGVQPLLDAIIAYLPSPLDRPIITGKGKDGKEAHRKADPNDPFSALIFKVMTDPYVGRLAFLRIYSGILKTGGSILNVSRDKKVRIGKLVHMHANNRQEIESAQAGDIVAAIGLKLAGTGNTLADLQNPLLLESIDFPEPVMSRALEPKRPGDYDKMREALDHLLEEDPTLRSFTHEETGQTILSGMGELHLEIIIDRLIEEFGVRVNTGKPQVTYKESISNSVTIDYTLSHAAGTQSVYAYVKLIASPRERGAGHAISNSISDRKIPKAFIEAAEEGVRQSLLSGILGGYEVIDMAVTICDLDFDEDQSTEVAFMTAGAYALTEALKEGASKLLEPIFDVDIHCPETYIGDVMDDIKRRKGSISAMEILPKSHKVVAAIPLSNLFGYASDIRSITRGNGHYTMTFSHYA